MLLFRVVIELMVGRSSTLVHDNLLYVSISALCHHVSIDVLSDTPAPCGRNADATDCLFVIASHIVVHQRLCVVRCL